MAKGFPCYDEMTGLDGQVLPHYAKYSEWLASMPPERIAQKRTEAEVMFHRVGVTFAVYGENGDAERLIPFDLVPRIIPASDWQTLHTGLKQRVRALNLFLRDIYHDQEILAEGLIPAEKVLNNSQYRPEMRGMNVPGDVYAHVDVWRWRWPTERAAALAGYTADAPVSDDFMRMWKAVSVAASSILVAFFPDREDEAARDLRQTLGEL